jgi:fumarylacetoacetate (FAA) hydrolase
LKLATLRTAGTDGRLIVVSSDETRFLAADSIAPTLQAALDRWAETEPGLRTLSDRLASGGGAALESEALTAPLPRAWQWLDGSAFEAHGRLMTRISGVEIPRTGAPLMYQGMSHQFLGPHEDVLLPRESDDIDFEGEFGVITDAVPMGVTADQAASHVKLVVIVNDWSLRALAVPEMKSGFGWIQAKPACSLSPFAVTPDELGSGWDHNRVQMRLRIDVNGEWFGEPHGGEMSVGFNELIAHAAGTRTLCAGTILGSGTVASDAYETVGSACISERRAIELLNGGVAVTDFLRFGDRVRLAAVDQSGSSPFGVLDQRVMQAGAPNGSIDLTVTKE